MGLRRWWSRRRGGDHHRRLDTVDTVDELDTVDENETNRPGTSSTTSPSSPTFTLARLPSRLVVDVDFAKDWQGKMPVCELVHMVVERVIFDLDKTCLPEGRKKAAERQALKSFCTVSIGKQTYVTPDSKLVTFEDEGGEGGERKRR